MTKPLSLAIVAGLAASAPLAWSPASFADDAQVVTPSTPTTTVVAPASEHPSYAGPNRWMLGSGLTAFGVTYVPSVIVAATSSLPADHHLYVPVVGPWLDLGNRPACGIGWIGCDTETANKVLLIGDGILQGIGVLTTIGAFLAPEHDVTVVTASDDKPTVHVTPAQFGASSYGVAAFGNF